LSVTRAYPHPQSAPAQLTQRANPIGSAIFQVSSARSSPRRPTREATGDGTAAALRAGARARRPRVRPVPPHGAVAGIRGAGAAAAHLRGGAGRGARLVDGSCRPCTRWPSSRRVTSSPAPSSGGWLRRGPTTCCSTPATSAGRSCASASPASARRLAEHGYDLAEDLVPVAPAQHYHSGGVLTDLVGRTSLPGLYAVGETSCTGVHRGARRQPAGLELPCWRAWSSPTASPAMCVAYHGRRAAVRRAGRVVRCRCPGPGGVAGRRPAGSERRAGRRPVGEGLAEAARALAAVPTSDATAEPATAEWEATNLHQVATALTLVAALRTETRGGHLRVGLPEADDDRWLVRQVVALDDEARLAVRERVSDGSSGPVSTSRSEGCPRGGSRRSPW